jgi:hypothetical protein
MPIPIVRPGAWQARLWQRNRVVGYQTMTQFDPYEQVDTRDYVD